MKHCKACNETKPLAEFGVDRAAASGVRYRCKACDAKAAAAYRERNPDAAKRATENWRKGNPDQLKAQRKAWREANPDYMAKWAEKNRSSCRTYYMTSSYKRPVAARMQEASRRAAKMNATPKWADKSAITEVYQLAREFRDAGFNVHVDHIVPLRGKTVCGLHVAENLRVLMASKNQAKGNRFA